MNYDASQFDNTYAQKEGWFLADEGDIQALEKVVAGSRFPYDSEAIAHVRKLADTGSAYHKEAWEIHYRWANRPQPVPPEILEEITLHEMNRLSLDRDSVGDMEYAAFFPNYCTGSPGYHGPVVVILWSASPGAVSTYIQTSDNSGTFWTHCNSSSW